MGLTIFARGSAYLGCISALTSPLIDSALASGLRPSARTATPPGFSQPLPRPSLGSNCGQRLGSNLNPSPRLRRVLAPRPPPTPRCLLARRMTQEQANGRASEAGGVAQRIDEIALVGEVELARPIHLHREGG